MTAPSNVPNSVIPPPRVAFQYEAQSPSGEALRGTIEAPSPAVAQARLAALNLRVLSIGPAPTAAVTKTPLGADDFLLFNQHLAHLTQAGLPVESGLRLIAADLRSGRLSAAANAVAADLESGLSLPDAFARHTGQFPALYSRLVDAGVKSGNLPGMLFGLGRHLELVNQLRRTLWRIFAYPIAATIALAAVLLFISTRVLPRFDEVFRDFRTTLPGITELLLWLGRVYPYILICVAVPVAILLVIVETLRLTGRSGYLVDRLVLPIPIIGRIVRASLLARWCDALRLGVEAGLDLPRAIELASQATASPRLIRDGASLTQFVSSGAPQEAFHGDLIPATVPAAIELSGRSGELSATLATITHIYEEQAQYRLHVVPALLTPILMFCIAGVIGFAVLALFMPLVKLISSLSGGD